MDEVRSEQARVLEEGRTLGYSIVPEETALSWDETQWLIDMIVRILFYCSSYFSCDVSLSLSLDLLLPACCFPDTT
jgi:hypothetical protein